MRDWLNASEFLRENCSISKFYCILLWNIILIFNCQKLGKNSINWLLILLFIHFDAIDHCICYTFELGDWTIEVMVFLFLLLIWLDWLHQLRKFNFLRFFQIQLFIKFTPNLYIFHLFARFFVRISICLQWYCYRTPKKSQACPIEFQSLHVSFALNYYFFFAHKMKINIFQHLYLRNVWETYTCIQ